MGNKICKRCLYDIDNCQCAANVVTKDDEIEVGDHTKQVLDQMRRDEIDEREKELKGARK